MEFIPASSGKDETHRYVHLNGLNPHLGYALYGSCAELLNNATRRGCKLQLVRSITSINNGGHKNLGIIWILSISCELDSQHELSGGIYWVLQGINLFNEAYTPKPQLQTVYRQKGMPTMKEISTWMMQFDGKPPQNPEDAASDLLNGLEAEVVKELAEQLLQVPIPEPT